MLKSNVVSALFYQHARDLRNIVTAKFKNTPQDAEDLVQEAFQNFLKLDQVDHITDPKSYLLQTASNLAISRIRKQNHHEHYLNAVDHLEADERSPERAIAAERDIMKLKEALNKLPEKYRKTFLLSRLEGKSYKEISNLLQIPQSTVEKHMIKTLKHLRDCLGREG